MMAAALRRYAGVAALPYLSLMVESVESGWIQGLAYAHANANAILRVEEGARETGVSCTQVEL